MPQDAQGRYYPDNEALAAGSGSLAAAAKTTTGSSAAFSTADMDSINALLVLTAVGGTNPTLDLALETTADGTNYYSAGAFPQQTANNAGISRIFGNLGATSRWTWTIGGTDTPTFTIAITATANKDD